MQKEEPNLIWEELRPLLDEAMAQLGEVDRNALVLRFFENKSARDVGVALGINEDAAQKQLGRAVERLRGLCQKRGLAVSAIALTIEANPTSLPPVDTRTTSGAVTMPSVVRSRTA